MRNSREFTVDLLQCVVDTWVRRAAEIGGRFGDMSDLRTWMAHTAVQSCRARSETCGYCEVDPAPTYRSEGVVETSEPDERSAGDAGDTGNVGDLRVGGPDQGADHCWLFAELLLFRGADELQRLLPKTAQRLLRLGWKKSAAIMFVIEAIPNGALPTALERHWDRPAVVDPTTIKVPDRGSLRVFALDVKRDPADTLTTLRGP